MKSTLCEVMHCCKWCTVVCKMSRERCSFLNRGNVSTTMHLTAIARNSSVGVIEVQTYKNPFTHACLCTTVQLLYIELRTLEYLLTSLSVFYVQHLLFHEQVRANNLSVKPIESSFSILSHVLLNFSKQHKNFSTITKKNTRETSFKLVVRRLQSSCFRIAFSVKAQHI